MHPPPAYADLHAMPDDQLMLAYAGGNRAAFDLLYSRHETALYRFVRRLLGIQLSNQVDEVFQDTWLRIVSARATFSPQGATWRTWAFTIAYNQAMDRLREIGREVSYYAHDEDGDGLDAAHLFDRGVLRRDVTAAPGTHASAEDIAFWQAAGRRLLACLDELPADQRAAFLLHHEDGFTVDAMAMTLDVGFETIKSRLRYALKKLRGCMERYLTALGQAA